VLTGEIRKREACREYELHWQTLKKILAAAKPPPFRPKVPRAKPRVGPFLPIIHQILEADRTAPPKQRHTAERIFQRLRDEHGYTGCSSIVRAAGCNAAARARAASRRRPGNLQESRRLVAMQC
jgi:hypothetical protein